MDFKEWLLLKEMAHKVIYDSKGKKEIVVQTSVGEITEIDFRFEDYPKTMQNELQLLLPLLKDQIQQPPYYGKLPKDSKYVYYNGDFLTVKDSQPEDGIELPENDRFHHSWWDYAEAYKGNKIVKPALKPREDQLFKPSDINKPFFGSSPTLGF